MRRTVYLLPVCLTLMVACGDAGDEGPAIGASGAQPSPYLFVWAGDQDEGEGDTNFLAVVDVDPASPSYGHVVATAPIGVVGGMPHHSELAMPPAGQPLFANAFSAGETWLFDLSDPLRPTSVGRTDPVPGYRTPHSFLRVPDGTVLATFQFSEEDLPGRPGALVRFSPEGRVLDIAGSADPAFPGERIRTYALDASPTIDRVITTSSPMDDEVTADVVQVWRLSDLDLLKTVPVPEAAGDTAHLYPFEVRFLKDGQTAIMNTFYCGFYLLTELDTEQPRIERVLALEHPKYTWCGVPVLIDDYWIMPVEKAGEVVVLDVADHRAPRIVSRLRGDSTFIPHWAARDPGSNRIVLVDHADESPQVLLALLDTSTGALSWDESFRDPETGRLGVSFARDEWPHGTTGPAMPHGVVFGGSP